MHLPPHAGDELFEFLVHLVHVVNYLRLCFLPGRVLPSSASLVMQTRDPIRHHGNLIASTMMKVVEAVVRSLFLRGIHLLDRRGIFPLSRSRQRLPAPHSRRGRLSASMFTLEPTFVGAGRASRRTDLPTLRLRPCPGAGASSSTGRYGRGAAWPSWSSQEPGVLEDDQEDGVAEEDHVSPVDELDEAAAVEPEGVDGGEEPGGGARTVEEERVREQGEC
uniref:Uncharacterized protein n=1 Tax=Triticum urartu TaxID=4572 RepID=A0A8R7NZZ1_TRIUA